MPTSVSVTPPSSRRRAVKAAARIGLLVFSLVVAAVGSELAVRLVAPQPASWMDIYARRPGLPFFVLAPNVDETVSNGESHWRILTDARARRVPATAEPKPRAKPEPAYVLGDSFAFGTSVDYADCIVGLLDAGDPDRRWVDLAVPGHGPPHFRMILEEALRQGPVPERVLVVTYMGNDFFDCIWNKDLPVRNGIIGNPGGLRVAVKRNSHLYRLCSNLWHVFGQLADDMDSEDLYRAAVWDTGELGRAYTIYRDEFAKIAAICQSRGIDLFACLIPTRRSVRGTAGGEPEAKGAAPLDLTLPTRKARAALEELGIPFVDASSELATLGEKQAFLRFDSHLTPAGNRVVARCIMDHWPSNSPKAPSSEPRPAPPSPK